jgi:hypothetical protein
MLGLGTAEHLIMIVTRRLLRGLHTSWLGRKGLRLWRANVDALLQLLSLHRSASLRPLPRKTSATASAEEDQCSCRPR